MLIRWIARPLLASWFVAEGIDTVRRPVPHVVRTEAAWLRLVPSTSPPPDPDQLRTLVRAHGAALAIAGILLGMGKAPRTAGLALALLTVPLALADAPRRHRGETQPTESRAEKSRFLRDLSLIGAALVAALDRAGRPSVGWRMHHPRVKPVGS